MLDEVLKWLGAGDAAISAMGPILTVLLSWVGGIGFTQFLKFPLSRLIDGAWYDWTVRLVAFVCSAALAHYLADSLNVALEVITGATSLLAYKGSLAAIRRYWPWLEANPMVGSVTPPQSAIDAAQARKDG